MSAHIVKQEFDDYLDGVLDDARVSALLAHVKICADCHATLLQAKAYRQLMTELPINEVDEQTISHAFARAASVNKRVIDRNFMQGFASAIAASLLVWSVVSIWPDQQKTPNLASQAPQVAVIDQNIQQVRMTHDEPKTVRLVFNTEKELKDVTLTIELPDNVELVGYPGRRQLSWASSFKQGANLLKLPLVSKTKTGGLVVASIRYQGKTKIFKVNLLVDKTANITGQLNSERTLYI